MFNYIIFNALFLSLANCTILGEQEQDYCFYMFTDSEGNSVRDISLLNSVNEARVAIEKNELALIMIDGDPAAYMPLPDDIRDRYINLNFREISERLGYAPLIDTRLSREGVDLLSKNPNSCQEQMEKFEIFARSYNGVIARYIVDLMQ